jgi:outer membrane protein
MKLSRVASLIGAVSLIAASASATNAQAPARIGVFDAQRISQETIEGSKIHAKLTALQEKKRAELKKVADEIEALRQQLLQGSSTLSEEKAKELTLQLERKQIELDGMQKSAQREVSVEIEQAQATWQKRVLDAVSVYGKEQGFALLIPVEVVGYAAASIDVTGDLIQIIDKPAPAGAPEK